MSFTPAKLTFWKDEPDGQQTLPASFGFPHTLITIYRVLGILLAIGIVFFLWYQVSLFLAWSWLLFTILFVGYIFYKRKRRKLSESDIVQTQQKARVLSGASMIGSAIHVAGHPLLEREQPIVLTLSSEGLKIFSYDDPNPIDTISPNQLVAFHTVVYDDKRTPHIDVIDSAAQALQITFKYQDREFTCLFRRMRKVHPIDWYHELQKAQWQLIRQ